MTPPTDRREFLRRTAALTAALSCSSIAGMAEEITPVPRPSRRKPKQLKARLLECLGGPWPDGGALRPELQKTEQKDGYRLEHVTYEAESGDRIPAFMLVPDGVSAQSPAPGIAVWHQHNGEWHIGKSGPAGLAGDPSHFTAVALARQGSGMPTW